jgi:hypothetical protein
VFDFLDRPESDFIESIGRIHEIRFPNGGQDRDF